MNESMNLPRVARFFGPLLNTLRDLDGSGKPKQVFEKLASSEHVTQDVLKATLKSGGSRFENEIAWARYYLFIAGLIDNSERGVWKLTEDGHKTHLDNDTAIELYREINRRRNRYTQAQRDEEITPPSADDEPDSKKKITKYKLIQIIKDGCFLSEEDLNSAFSSLQNKMSLILQGPPGTGKTWLAKRLGYVLIGTNNHDIIRKQMRSIQFHPSLSYEDFVRGWRPNEKGKLSLINGVFLNCIEAARAQPDQNFVVIIEEINRGNPAQIFGEMLTLLEKDKRKKEEAIELAYPHYRGEGIFLPTNLFLIGTMNIADRSLALVDYALRRRFAFVNLEPSLNDSWIDWCTKRTTTSSRNVFEKIQKSMNKLNEVITADPSLGPQYRIGHSYVTPSPNQRIEDPKEWFDRICKNEIKPLLEEYWINDIDKVEKLISDLSRGL